MRDYKNWQLTKDSNNIYWLAFDLRDKSANVLTHEALNELDSIVSNISKESDYEGLVIHSKKDSGFIFGADVPSFVEYDKKQIEKLLELGQGIFNNIENIKNTVAAINGLSLGGGTELALACDYRILSEDAKMGLPEVTLGILPGWGGTLRLPRLIGSIQALPIMVSGKAVAAKKAKALGLCDDVVASRQLMSAAQWFVLKKPKKNKAPWYDIIFKIPFFKRLFAKIVNNQISKKVRRDHYPAPYQIVKTWLKLATSPKAVLANERKAFLKLIDYKDVAKNLIRVYSLQQLLKKEAKGKTNIKHIHVIGAGVMGADIAIWSALKGFKTTFSDTNVKSLGNVMKNAHKLYKRILKRGHKLESAIDRLVPDYNAHGIATADLIIEAVSEDIKIKHLVWKDVNKRAKKDAVLATNTSSLPLKEISCVLDDSTRLIGVHFFNPVSMMPLVEVIFDENKDSTQYQEAVNFVKEIGKLPLPAKSNHGFLVNRVLMPYMVDAFAMLDEGYSIGDIDKALRDYGMPMGPIELADRVGLDICLSVGEKMQDILNMKVPQNIHDLVENGKLGMKTNGGLYEYSKGKAVKKPSNASENKLHEISERLIGKMHAEAQLCLKEGIVENEDYLDAGMIFGTGFAPFKGGLMNAYKK